MRVVVIGGSGHVGTFLVPRLVEAGHEVVSISRGRREPYQSHPAWQSVEQLTLDREAEEAEGTFEERVLGLEPDVVVDMICFTPESARQLVEALRGADISLPALRDHLGARPQHKGADHRGSGAPSVRGVRYPEGQDRSVPARRSAARSLPCYRPASRTHSGTGLGAR